MTSKKKIILGLSALVIAIALATVVSKKFNHGPRVESMDDVLKRDRLVLANPNATEIQIFTALVRLGGAKDPLAKPEALKLLKNKSPMVREGCAVALSYLDDGDSLSGIESLLRDTDVKVRTRAIEGLTHHWSKERQAVLEKLMKDKTLKTIERIELSTGAIRISNNAAIRNAALSELIKIAKGEGVTSAEADYAVTKLLVIAPNDSLALEFFREIIKKGTRTSVLPTAILQLALVQDKWLHENAAVLGRHADEKVRTVFFQTLFMTCPESRVEVMRNALMNEKNEKVLSEAIKVLVKSPTIPMINAATEALAKRKFDNNNGLQLNRVLSLMKKSQPIDPCGGMYSPAKGAQK